MKEQEIFDKAMILFDNNTEKAMCFLELLNLSHDVHVCKLPDLDMILPAEEECEYCRNDSCYYRAPDSILSCSVKNCPLHKFTL